MIMERNLFAACAALAVFALAMVVPQGTALAKGMDVKTADLFPTDDIDVIDCSSFAPPDCESEGFGTAAAVTDNRTRLFGGNRDPWTAWAVSWEGLHRNWYYGVYNDPLGDLPCGGDTPESKDEMSVYSSSVHTMSDGSAFTNLAGRMNPENGDTVWICRRNDTPYEGASFNPLDRDVVLIPILSGVLEGGGRNNSSKKKNR